MQYCIYCKTEINDQNKSIEHIFPQSFGCPDSFVLDCVCVKCNNTLGGTIDRWLANDSVESVARLKTLGSKSKQKVRPKRLLFTIPYEEKFQKFQGAKMERDFNTGEISLPPQVGFKDKDSLYKYFTKSDLQYPPRLEEARSLSQKEIKLLAHEPELNDLISFMKTVGISFTSNAEGKFQIGNEVLEDGNKLRLDVSATIDSDIQRAIAKIAFNYAAHIQGSVFVLNPRFDQIRNFITNGTQISAVTPSSEIAAQGGLVKKPLNGHVFILERIDSKLIAHVSLFNFGFKYKIILTDNMGPIWYEIKGGHFFDVKTKKLQPLLGVSRALLPPNFI